MAVARPTYSTLAGYTTTLLCPKSLLLFPVKGHPKSTLKRMMHVVGWLVIVPSLEEHDGMHIMHASFNLFPFYF